MIQITNYQTRTSKRNSQRGFTLMELLIVMSIMIILMLIAIPNFISMKAQADETSAIQSLRAIYQAQIQYQTNFPSNGFACSLAALGGNTCRAYTRFLPVPSCRPFPLHVRPPPLPTHTPYTFLSL